MKATLRRFPVAAFTAAVVFMGAATPAAAKISAKQKEELQGYVASLVETTDPDAEHAVLLIRGLVADAKDKKALLALESSEASRVRLGAKLAGVLAGDKKAPGRVVDEIIMQEADHGTIRWALAPLPDALEIDVLKGLVAKAKEGVLLATYQYLAETRGKSFGLLTAALSGKDETHRKAAAQAAVQSGRADVLDTAKTMLASKDDKVRREGVDLVVAFSRMPHALADARVLLGKATADRANSIREVAARRLVELNDGKGTTALLALAADEPDAAKASRMLTFLLDHGSKVSASSVSKWLESDNAELKKRAYQITAAAKDGKFENKLVEMHASTEFEDRLLAVQSIGFTKSGKASSVLTTSLFEARRDIRLAAAHGLVALGRADTLDALKTALGKERDKEIKLTIVDAIGAVGGKAALQVLRFQITTTDVDLKLRTIDAIAKMGLPEGGKALDILMRDRNSDVQQRAFVAMLELDPKAAKRYFTTVFRNPAGDFMSEVYAVEGAGAKMVRDYLIGKATGSARATEVRRLMRSGGDDASLYKIALSAGDDGLQRELVYFLGSRAKPKDLMTLEAIARGRNRPVARTAAWMLTRHPSKSLEASYRGYLVAGDDALKAIAGYGLATVWR